MEVFETAGAIGWHELMTDDVDGAKRFYSEVLGWTLEDMPMKGMEKPYTVIKVGEESIGGIMEKPPQAAQAPNTWINYITVDDVDQTLERATSYGGKVVTPPMDVPGVGRMAHIQDTSGTMIAIIRYQME